jgi:hypothetical protein
MSFGRCGFVAAAITGFLLLGSIERLQHVRIVLDHYSTVTLDFNEYGAVVTAVTNREPVRDSSNYLVSPSRSHSESHGSAISLLEGRLNPLIQVRDTIPASFTVVETIYTYGVRARVFGLWNASRDALPCYEPELDWKKAQNQPSSTGFLFVKPYKTGSSTAAGVNLRIARNVARRLNATASRKITICKARSNHAKASKSFVHRDRTRSFMWTIIREPSSRVVSQYFHFYISRKKIRPTDAAFEHYLRKGTFTGNHYLSHLSPARYIPSHVNDTAAFINNILDAHDFVGVTERMDESFVAVSMLLGVPLADVLYLKAKVRGGYDDGGGRCKCTYIRPSFVTKGMQSMLQSDFWAEKSRWDRLVHAAANRSLDLTIEALCVERFHKNLQRFLEGQKRAQELCLPKVIFPCSPVDGHFTSYSETDCLWNDSGCGVGCLDSVADELGLWE